MKNNVVSLADYKAKEKSRAPKIKKNLTWLYSLSEYDLISEFIESHNDLENNSSSKDKAEWLDTVSEVMSFKFFDTNESVAE